MKHVGFTGTQEGCTRDQFLALINLIRKLVAPPFGVATETTVDTLHHGDCVGADRDAHYAGRVLGMSLHVHPPINSVKRAFCRIDEGDKLYEPLDYIERNHKIVDASWFVIACPKELTGSTVRSGTWATVRYALKMHKAVRIIRPDGAVEKG